jgi:hypothetical protein
MAYIGLTPSIKSEDAPMTDEKIDFHSLSLDDRCDLAVCLDTLKRTRQIFFDKARSMPHHAFLRTEYERMETEYVGFCERLGVVAQPVFDLDKWQSPILGDDEGAAFVRSTY